MIIYDLCKQPFMDEKYKEILKKNKCIRIIVTCIFLV